MNKKHRHALFVSFALSLVAATAHGADAVVASPDGRTMLRIAEDDLSKMDADTLRILTSQDVIAVDQDPLGKQGRRALKEGDLEVWVRPLAGGEHAVVLFNRGNAPAEMKVGWDQLNLPSGLKAHVKDLDRKGLEAGAGSYGGTVASHGVIMLRITPVL